MKQWLLPVDYTKLSWEERKEVRELYIEAQEGRCYYCKEQLKDLPLTSVLQKTIKLELFPEGFFDHPIHLQHNHRTGMTEGAVHAYCNAVLWQYEGR